MTNTNSSPPNQPKPPLRRSQSDRMMAGVAAGIARSLGIDAGLVRLAFVLLTIFGGSGVLLYFIGWLAIPSDDTGTSALEDFSREKPKTWIGIAVIAVGLIMLAGASKFTGAGIGAGIALLVIGIAMYAGFFTMLARDNAGEPKDGRPLTAQVSSESAYSAMPPPAPSTTPGPFPRPRPPRSALGRVTLAILIIGIGLIALTDGLERFDAQPRHYFAWTFAVIGVGLLIGSLVGRARGLVALGIILTPIALMSPLLGGDFDSTAIRVVQPASTDTLESSYELGAGTLLIDLTNLEPPTGPVDLAAHVGVGRLVVVVGEGLGVSGNARIDIGTIDVLGDSAAKVGRHRRTFEWAGPSGPIRLDLSMNVGKIEVVDTRPTDLLYARTAATNVDRVFVIDQNVKVSNLADLADGYWAGAGSLTLDLSRLDVESFTEPRRLDIRVVTGEVIVVLPRGLATHVSASVTAGELILPNDSRSGVGISGSTSSTDPLLIIDIRVGAGSIRVEGK